MSIEGAENCLGVLADDLGAVDLGLAAFERFLHGAALREHFTRRTGAQFDGALCTLSRASSFIRSSLGAGDGFQPFLCVADVMRAESGTERGFFAVEGRERGLCFPFVRFELSQLIKRACQIVDLCF